MKDIAVDAVGGNAVLTAPVYREGSDRPSLRLEFTFHDLPPDAISDRGDPFVPALLALAMTMREDLTIEAPVSPKLVANLDQIERLHLEWWTKLRPVKVLAPQVPADHRAADVGMFFSGGVDSFYTLLRNMQGRSVPDDPITHLVFVAGFEVDSPSAEYVAAAGGRVRDVAEATGTQAIIVTTNLRTELRLWWMRMQGASLATVGHALSPMLGTCFIAGSYMYKNLTPWGTHPVLDPLWSSESMRIHHEGWDADRSEKIRYEIARSDLALSTLRVCPKPEQQPMNCGRCAKCIRTMVCLYTEGVLDRCDTFVASLDPRTVHKMDAGGMNLLAPSILAGLGDSKLDHSIARAVRRRAFKEEVLFVRRALFPTYTRRGRWLRGLRARFRSDKSRAR